MISFLMRYQIPSSVLLIPKGRIRDGVLLSPSSRRSAVDGTRCSGSSLLRIRGNKDQGELASGITIHHFQFTVVEDSTSTPAVFV